MQLAHPELLKHADLSCMCLLMDVVWSFMVETGIIYFNVRVFMLDFTSICVAHALIKLLAGVYGTRIDTENDIRSSKSLSRYMFTWKGFDD